MALFAYVNRFLVGKTSGANTGTTLQTITPGDLLFVDENGVLLDTAAKMAAVGDRNPIYLAMGLKLGVPRLSFPIRRREVKNFTREPYAAKREQIDSIDLTGLTAGAHYKLISVLRDEMRTISDRQTKLEIADFVPVGTLATDGAKLAALINKNPVTKGMLLATFVTPNLVITGQPVPAESVLDEYQYVSFTTTFTKMVQFADNLGYPGISNGTPLAVTTTQKASPGSGVPASLAKLELQASGYLGNNDLTHFDRPVFPSRLDPNGQYDIIHLIHFDKHQGDFDFTMESPLQTTIAVATGSALATSIEVLLKAFINKDATVTTTSTPDPDQNGGE